MTLKFITSAGILLGLSYGSFAQVLYFHDALERSVSQYQKIKSKQALISASQQRTIFQKNKFLPDLTLAAQQSFGTINAQNGPLYAYGGLASASTSMPLAEQNWNAAFGSLYFANVNWNLFTFGRLKQAVQIAKQEEHTSLADLNQEIFQHQVKVGAAYLNLLASQRIRYVQRKNLERAKVFYDLTDSRSQSGLIPEVDASLARAEVSNAQSLQIKAYDHELEYSKMLAVLLSDTFQEYRLDTLFNTSIPTTLPNEEFTPKSHPMLVWQRSKVKESVQVKDLINAHKMPTLSAFGVIQGRGSGFDWNYVQDQTAYSPSYFRGVGINRGNYLLGVSLSWNVTDYYRQQSKVKAQTFLTLSLQHEYTLVEQELNAQSALAKVKLTNALANFEETKVQLSAAVLAYQQHSALYENGLTTLVDFTQALYSLNRAEIDFEIGQNNVWQALLLLASAQGDLSILLNAINK